MFQRIFEQTPLRRKIVEVVPAFDGETALVREVRASRHWMMRGLEAANKYAKIAAGKGGVVITGSEAGLREALDDIGANLGWSVSRFNVAPWYGGVLQEYRTVVVADHLCIVFRVHYTAKAIMWYVQHNGNTVAADSSGRSAIITAHVLLSGGNVVIDDADAERADAEAEQADTQID